MSQIDPNRSFDLGVPSTIGVGPLPLERGASLHALQSLQACNRSCFTACR